jgi:hypothetical protein
MASSNQPAVGTGQQETPEMCANSQCGGEGDPCWETASGKMCRDASLCKDGSCSGPGYAPPVVTGYQAELPLPPGSTLRDAWLVLEDAAWDGSQRRLLDTFATSAGVARFQRPGMERLVFDVGLFKTGMNRFRVRGEAVEAGSATPIAIETATAQRAYDLPNALGHVAAGTFRLPLIHFPRSVTGCRGELCKDRDGDGLNDLWENVAATQLRPRLMMDSADELFERPADAVRVLTSVVPLHRHGETYVVFANVIAFSRDYGYLGTFGHAGDTEAAGMLFRVDANETLHWVASTSKGHACLLCKPQYRFNQQEFASDGAPLLFVERNKHGLWQDGKSCRQEAGFSCRGDRKLRPDAVNVGDSGPGRSHALVDSLDGLASSGPFGALAGLFPGEAVWTPEKARVRGRFCGGQRTCSQSDSANQPGAVIARLVQLFQTSAW